MKQDPKLTLVKLLSDGQFHSGERLGELLSMSRAAISAHIKKLKAMGLDIYSVTGKGYKLQSSYQMLDKTKIIEQCSAEIDLDIFPIIDSTNSHLMDKIRNNNQLADGYTLLAEMQTAGKGRRGRQWISPFASHIYFSQYRKMEEGLSASAGLGLAIAVALVEAIKELTQKQVGLKWPNDLLYKGQKLAGILVEAEGQANGVCHLVIGIGININMPAQSEADIDQPWTDLQKISETEVNRNELAALMIKWLDHICTEYRQNGLQNLSEQWNQYNAYKDQMVNIISINKTITGRCLGIDQTGALLLDTSSRGSDASIQKIYGGEVSLRKA